MVNQDKESDSEPASVSNRKLQYDQIVPRPPIGYSGELTPPNPVRQTGTRFTYPGGTAG